MRFKPKRKAKRYWPKSRPWYRPWHFKSSRPLLLGVFAWRVRLRLARLNALERRGLCWLCHRFSIVGQDGLCSRPCPGCFQRSD